jgi:hypothetical protein
MTLDELVQPLVEAGRTKAKNPTNAVRAAIGYHPDFVEGLDGRLCSLADQLEGAVFTVALMDLELDEEIVLLRDGLTLIEQLLRRTYRTESLEEIHLDRFGSYFDLPWTVPSHAYDSEATEHMAEFGVDDHELDEETAEILLAFMDELGIPPGDRQDQLRELTEEMRFTPILHGPPGWLPAVGPRDLLGIRVTRGTVETMTLTRRSVQGPHVEAAARRIAGIARQVIGPDASWFGPPIIPLSELLELVIAEAPEVFRRALPPLVEVIRKAGLEVEDGLVGHLGTDWDDLPFSDQPNPGDAWGWEPPLGIQ